MGKYYSHFNFSSSNKHTTFCIFYQYFHYHKNYLWEWKSEKWIINQRGNVKGSINETLKPIYIHQCECMACLCLLWQSNGCVWQPITCFVFKTCIITSHVWTYYTLWQVYDTTHVIWQASSIFSEWVNILS